MASLSKYHNLSNAIIPISRFNKGEAAKIFGEVVQTGIKIVVKNNKPACVLLSPEEYQRMLDEMENYVLLKEALARMEKTDSSLNLSQKDLMAQYGISQNMLDETEVDLE